MSEAQIDLIIKYLAELKKIRARSDEAVLEAIWAELRDLENRIARLEKKDGQVGQVLPSDS